ncbi:hypothetical protein EPN15_02885 [Patescibacteria group bacterium]|nr:MAG: hypothetical protein EPN15_02885 [Patescibacteria group bacterium]
MKVPETIQEAHTQENETDCFEADYQDDGGVFIKVICPGRVIHVVVRLKPQSNYAVLIGDDPIRIMQASPGGIIVFENPSGKDVELIMEMSDEELKKNSVKGGE